jgi:peptide/nickel transport system ATP-binding protein
MLNVQDLKVTLDADAGLVRAVDGLTLAMRRGETFALVGESGCGKSMTALALMRLLPESGRIAGGRLHLGDRELFELPESAMRDVRGGRIGMIFQEPGTSLNPVMRVGDQIVEAIEAHTDLRGNAARAKAIEWLGRVGIPEPQRRIDDYPFRLSGGQKQRVMIAIALAAEPDFLIADEPTTALDVTIQKQILDLLRRLQREQGMGMLLITHDLAVVSEMAHHVALMYAGQIVEVATVREFFSDPRHPYAKLLLEALPDAGKRGEGLAAIAGTVPPLWQEFTACRFAPRCPKAHDKCLQGEPALQSLGASHAARCVLAASADAAPVRVESHTSVQAELVEAPVQGSPVRQSSPGQVLDAPQPLLQVTDLAVRFPLRSGLLNRIHGHFTAVDRVSFTLAAGQTLALVGESGCGKTTTGKAITQLLRHVATLEGQALLQGQDLFTLQGDPLRVARRQIQMIFQDPFASLNPRMRVREILEEGLVALRPELDAGQRSERVGRLVERVGLRADALDRYPHEFSGGQRQRIAIARALAVEPRVIVCDEPTSALDVSVQAQILNLLRELQSDTGVSFLFVTHNIGVVEYVADWVAVMNEGRIVEAGTVDRVLGAPGDAYTRRLLDAVPRLAQVGETG